MPSEGSKVTREAGYYQFKMKKEVTIPISREVVRVIQEQQRYIRQHFTPEEFDYLFYVNGSLLLS